ncbi:MAG: beta-lactamase family protein [Limnochordaceae bacterium]|nr:beta-lactamase family protein [Limnochordaceae bacterium]
MGNSIGARFGRAAAVLKRFVDEGRLPGGVLLVGYRGEEYGPVAYGWAQLEPESEKRPMREDTLFDLASCSKVIGTTTAALMLIDRGEISLDDPISLFLPEWKGEGKENVRLWHLLTHTSGIPVAGDIHYTGGGPTQMIAGICSLPLGYAPGEHVVYTCYGFILLGEIIQRVSGQRLDVFLAQQVFKPLNMADTMYCPPVRLRPRIAATEMKPDHSGAWVGVVHDENARAMQGVSGNAGLFSTARDVGRFCRMYLQGGTLEGARILSPAVIEAATRSYTAGLEEERGLGWLLRGHGHGSPAGDLMSPSAYGHTGFTGTSLWVDPARDLYVVLLTNRVHPSRNNDSHIRLRPLVANAVVAALDDRHPSRTDD